MNLPFFKPKTSHPKREYFFTLEVDHGSVKSGIWTVQNGKSHVVSLGKSVAWDDESDPSFLEAADASLTDSINRLDPTGKTSVTKVIFGLPPDWINGDKIFTNRSQSLKYISQKLSLTPVGYVITPEAATKFLQQRDGVPPTLIPIGVWSHVVEVSLIKLGKVESCHVVKRSEHITADVVEGLSRVVVELLPSRMLLYDSGSDLEHIRQTLLAHPWQAPQTRLPFLHFPKIECLPPDFSVRAISLAGGTEVGISLGIISDTPAPSPAPASTPTVSPSSSHPRLETSLEDLGFSSSHPDQDSAAPALEVSTQTDDSPDIESDNTPPTPSASPAKKFRLPSFSTLHSLPSLPKFNFLWVIPLVLFLGSLFAAYWYLPKAEVVVTVSTQSLSLDTELVADSQVTSVDLSTSTVPATSLDQEVTADKSAQATGTKLIGDKATGTVVLINGTSVPKTFPAGTTLTSPTGLKFTFDAEVNVASASGTADPNSYTPGKANVKVSAAAIGGDYNLSAGTQLKVGSFSTLDFVARNEAAFSGGTSQQVKAVSKTDISELKKTLLDSLREQAKSELTAKVDVSNQLIDNSVTVQTVSEQFSAKEGDTVNEVKLTLKLKATGLVVSKPDVDQIIKSKLDAQVPSGFAVQGELNPVLKVGKTDKTRTQITASGSVLAVPQFNLEELKPKLAGLYPASDKTLIENLGHVTQIEFTFHPPLPTVIRTLPRVSENITLSVKY